jgi:hypothetical protein
MNQNVYVLYAGGPNFYIIINFEVDYLLNRWSYRNTGGLVGSEFFISSNFYYWQKLIRPTVREIANL